MRQERQWKVIGSEGGRRERPLQPIDAQSILEVAAAGYIVRVIKAKCTETERLGIDRDYGCDQNQSNAKVLPQAFGIFTAPQHGIPLEYVSAQSADDPWSRNQDAHTGTSYHAGCDAPRK